MPENLVRIDEMDAVSRSAMDVQILDKVNSDHATFSQMRKGYAEKWREDDEQYQNSIEKKFYKGISDIKVPVTYDAVETLVSFGIEVFFAKKMPVMMEGREGTDQQVAELYNLLLDYRMNSMSPDFRERFRRALLNLFKYGTTIVKRGYDNDLKGANFVPLRLESCYFNPYADSKSKLDMFIHKTRINENTLKANENIYENLDRIDTLKPVDPTNNEDETSDTGHGMYAHTKRDLGLSDMAYKSHVKYYDLYEAYFNWKVGDKTVPMITSVLNNKLMIRRKPSLYGKNIPFEIAALIEQEGTLYGKSIPRLARDHQVAINDITNQILDSGTAAITPMYAIDEAVDINTRELNFRQNGVVRVNGDPNRAVAPIRKDIRMDIAYQMRGSLNQYAQTLTGATPSLTDVFSASDTTAFESKRALSASTRRVISMLRRFEDNILTPWVKADVKYVKDFVQWKDVVRIVGKDAAELGEFRSTDVFDANMDATVIGLREIEDKVVKVQQAMNALNLATKVPHLANIPEFFKDVLKELGYKDVDKYVFTTPEQERKNPFDENMLMMEGKQVQISPRDNHPLHIQIHGQMEIVDEMQQMVMQDHLMQHQMAMQSLAGQQAALPPQEQPQGLPQPAPSGVGESEIRREVSTPERVF